MRDTAVITRFQLRSIVTFVLVFSAIIAIAAVGLGLKRQANERDTRVTAPLASGDFSTTLTSAEMRVTPNIVPAPNVEPLNAPPEPVSTGPGTLSIIHNDGVPDVTPGATGRQTVSNSQSPQMRPPNGNTSGVGGGVPSYGGATAYGGGAIGYGGAIDDTSRTQAQTFSQLQNQVPTDSQTFAPANVPSQTQTASGQIQMSAQQQQTPAQFQSQTSQQSQSSPAPVPAQGQTQPAPPATQPLQPVVQPVQPGTLPNQPGAQPNQPAQPSQPAAQPIAPSR